MTTATKARGPLYSAIDLERALIALFTEWKQATGPAIADHAGKSEAMLAQAQEHYLERLQALEAAIAAWSDRRADRNLSQAETVEYWLRRRAGAIRRVMVDPSRDRRVQSVDTPTVTRLAGAEKAHRVPLSTR